MTQERPSVILDTNVFVAAGFNPGSDSARIVRAVSEGGLRLVWNDQTRDETEHIIRQIPHLVWKVFAVLFREQDRYQGETHLERFHYIRDQDDRKFAALAEATGATLLSLDDDLLAHRTQIAAPVLTPGEFEVQHSDQAAS